MRRPHDARGGAHRPSAAGSRREAERQLRLIRRSSRLAVVLAGLLLLVWGAGSAPAEPSGGEAPPALAAAPLPVEARAAAPAAESDTARSVEEATGTLRGLWHGLRALLPKIAIALSVLLLAAGLSRLLRPVLRAALRSFSRAEALGALAGIGIWLLAIGVAASVLAGDVRALIGSLGLIGLALSWALQTPIESFTGWLLNSFRVYYRVGDRIEVGEVFGDVYKVDFLTTTVWEAGGPGKPVRGAQPTGALITFPNSEVLRANIVNYTRDFAFVWDEVTLGIANESDLRYAIGVVREAASAVIGPVMEQPAAHYRSLLDAAGLGFDVSTEPQVYVSLTDAWTNLTVRYLVDARERRRWASELIERLTCELARAEHAGRIQPSSPRVGVRLLDRAPAAE
jgi:small conductance mechanosensitive channel